MQYLSQRLAADPAKAPEEDRPLGSLAAGQRERILAATERLIAERGAPETTIEAIVKAAGVSSVTFYEHFRGKEECFAAAFDRAVEGLREALAEAIPAEGAWTVRVQAAMATLLATLDAEPARARLVFVEAQKGGQQLRALYEEALDAAAAGFPDSLGEAIVGGLAWLVRERLELGGGDGVQDLLPRMTEIVLAPYLGNGATAPVAPGDG